jgi:hypothetical protein
MTVCRVPYARLAGAAQAVLRIGVGPLFFQHGLQNWACSVALSYRWRPDWASRRGSGRSAVR